VRYETVVGLEIHVELNCLTKMFCDCPNRPGDEPNRNTCPVCLWLPGALPRFSREALEKAAMACLALDCEIQKNSAFDQKVYYYPDLPKGYQLSQAHRPLARGGWIDVEDEKGATKRLRIHHIHMEEDVARLVHELEGRTPVGLVDFNRAGAPLVEIVTEPDIRSAHEAMEFIRNLRTRIRCAGASDCSMESGTMRVDANISIREPGASALNTKVEVKNMNSIRHVGDAIAYEAGRQQAALEAGEAIVLHTRLWDPEKGVTLPMRGKFEGPCVPDPSVPEIVVSEEWIDRMRSRLPEMPPQKAARFQRDYGLPRELAVPLAGDRELSDYFEAVARMSVAPRTAAHWILAQYLPALKERQLPVAGSPVTPERLAGVLRLLEKDEITTNAARAVLSRLFESGEPVEAIVEQGGFRQVSDAASLETLVRKVLDSDPATVNAYRSGQGKALSFLIGQVIKASSGKANPKRVREILLAKLG
jgi:aspartyl-tRNA(Asn)/glutamyl-tRNA(Gln) amidotransferase subunit B